MATPKEALVKALSRAEEISDVVIIVMNRAGTGLETSSMDLGKLAYLSKWFDAVVNKSVLGEMESLFPTGGVKK